MLALTSAASGASTYTCNGDGVLVQADDTTYVQDLAAPLSQVLSDGTNTYLYGMDRLASVNASSRTWELHDALGSVRLHLDDQGQPAGSLTFDAWGTPTEGSPEPFGFTGELHSEGLVYLRARWYDAGAGVFLARDPFAGFDTMPYSLHYYQYGYSSPTMYTDPSGRCVVAGVDTVVCAGIIITAIIATAITTYVTYDLCITQGKCDQLARDLQQALDQRQNASTEVSGIRSPEGEPIDFGIGEACVPITLEENINQAIRNATDELVRVEGLEPVWKFGRNVVYSLAAYRCMICMRGDYGTPTLSQ